MSEYMGVMSSLRRIIGELIDGAAADRYAWVLNPGTDGLLGTLRRLDASEASAVRIPGRASIAAHANHIRFALESLNRKATGGQPFPDDEWAKSWDRQTVTDEQWQSLLAQLDENAHAWMDAVLATKPERDEDALTELLASAAHIAYHFGAIRQLLGIR